MNRWLAVLLVIVAISVGQSAESDPPIPKRIDGGILVPTNDSIKKLISACIPIRIVVSFMILEDGTTADLEVIEKEPDGVDTSIATDAVAQFQYEPIIVNGVPVRSGPHSQSHIYDPATDPNCDRE